MGRAAFQPDRDPFRTGRDAKNPGRIASGQGRDPFRRGRDRFWRGRDGLPPGQVPFRKGRDRKRRGEYDFDRGEIGFGRGELRSSEGEIDSDGAISGPEGASGGSNEARRLVLRDLWEIPGTSPDSNSAPPRRHLGSPQTGVDALGIKMGRAAALPYQN